MAHSLVGALVVVLISFLGACLGEAISWTLVYRTEAYKSVSKNLVAQVKKLDALKDSFVEGGPASQKNKEKRISQLKDHIKLLQRDASQLQIRSGFVVACVMIGIYWNMTNWFEGKVLAILPFEPFAFVQNLSHRGLLGDNVRECNAAFLYTIASFTIRPALQRALGFSVRVTSPDINPYAFDMK